MWENESAFGGIEKRNAGQFQKPVQTVKPPIYTNPDFLGDAHSSGNPLFGGGTLDYIEGDVYGGKTQWENLSGRLNKGIIQSEGAAKNWADVYGGNAAKQVMGQAAMAGNNVNSQATVRGLDASAMRSAGHMRDEIMGQGRMEADSLDKQAGVASKLKQLQIQQSVSDIQLAADSLYQSYLLSQKQAKAGYDALNLADANKQRMAEQERYFLIATMLGNGLAGVASEAGK
jgi:hypothetical protein